MTDSVRRANVITKLTSEMHDNVAEIYEAAIDGETKEALKAVTELQAKLKYFKTNIITNGEI